MRTLRIFPVFALVVVSAIAQDRPRKLTSDGQDLLSIAQTDHSLGMFVAAVHSSGLAKVLREDGSLTVFAPSNQAFAGLHKDQLDSLLAHPSAMHLLLSRYIVRGTALPDDAARLSSARTLAGVKLRVDVRSEVAYVNGAKLSHEPVRCANGVIYILNTVDPGLVRQALAVVRASQ